MNTTRDRALNAFYQDPTLSSLLRDVHIATNTKDRLIALQTLSAAVYQEILKVRR